MASSREGCISYGFPLHEKYKKMIKSNFSEWVFRGGGRGKEEEGRGEGRKRKGRTAGGEKRGGEEKELMKLEGEYGGSLGGLEGAVVHNMTHFINV